MQVLGINCMQLEAGCDGKIILVQLPIPVVRTNHTQVASYLTTKQVMHIRLPDKHNVSNHFCLQAFLSEQSFPSLSMSCCSSAVNYFVVFHSRFQFFSQSTLIIAASSNFITAVDIVQSYTQGFFCQQVHDIDYFPLQSFNWYFAKRGAQFQRSYHY